MFRFLALLKKELLQIFKNPKTRFIALAPPVVALFLLGYAATTDLKDVPFGILDQSHSLESRSLIDKFDASPIFILHRDIQNENDMGNKLARREIKAALVIPQSFSRDIALSQPASVQIIVDGRNTSSAGTILNDSNAIIQSYNAQIYPQTGTKIQISSRGWFNPAFNVKWFMLPALLAMLSLMIVTLLVSLTFAKEREGGTFDQLLLTPYSTGELLAAKALSGIIVGIIQVSLSLCFILFWFQVPYQSNYALLVLLIFFFLFAAVGIGLLISVHCSTLQQAMIWVFLFAVIFALLSGLATPVESMPDIMQKMMIINPVRWGVASLRRLFLEGATFIDILPTYLILAGIGAGTFSIGCYSLVYQRTH
ncbi:MAG: ABC transporter permease [Proteobacteria bacterium]|nr:ABC transporter permease [Pseudomonadota bacterium]